MPRDRYVARQAGADEARLKTPAVVFSATRLTVNAKLYGELRARILDEENHALAGFDFADCTPVRGDAVAHPIRWKTDLASLQGRLVRLEFAWTGGDLFAFDLAK